MSAMPSLLRRHGFERCEPVQQGLRPGDFCRKVGEAHTPPLQPGTGKFQLCPGGAEIEPGQCIRQHRGSQVQVGGERLVDVPPLPGAARAPPQVVTSEGGARRFQSKQEAADYIAYAQDAEPNPYEAEVARLSKQLQTFPRGATGLTPDDVKASPEFKAVKTAYAKAFEKLRQWNAEKIKKAKDVSVSEAQHKAMGAAAGGKSNLGIPKKVGAEFSKADKGKF